MMVEVTPYNKGLNKMKTHIFNVMSFKQCLSVVALMSAAVLVHAADPLNGTVWKTIDDKSKQPKAIVKFSEQKNGTLSATIQQVLTPGEENSCVKCEGTYHNKSLKGLTIVQNLKSTGSNTYGGGTILDPKNGKTYKLKGELAGQKLNLRGYIGVSALGRNQVWQRVQ